MGIWISVKGLMKKIEMIPDLPRTTTQNKVILIQKDKIKLKVKFYDVYLENKSCFFHMERLSFIFRKKWMKFLD